MAEKAKRPRTWRDVLRFDEKVSRAIVRKYYDLYRIESGIPRRCDKPSCCFHDRPLEWNGDPLPLILDHVTGVSADNRPENLRLLCPNCDSQLQTRGGKNKGRVGLTTGGFSLKRKDGRRDHTLVAETAQFGLTGYPVEMRISGGSPPSTGASGVEEA